MEKLKFYVAVGLCVALLMLPLAGMAGNPLPTGNNSDGHPWDDGDNSEEPGDPNDSLPDVRESSIGDGGNDRPLRSSTHFLFVWKWYLLLIW